MAFQDLKNRAEDFADFSAQVGSSYITARIFTAILGFILCPLNPLVRVFKIVVCYELVQLLLSPILVMHKINLYKQIGIKCEGCGCWVSKDRECPVCGQQHEFIEPKSLAEVDAQTAIAQEGMDETSWRYRRANMTHMMLTLYNFIPQQSIQTSIEDKNMQTKLINFKKVAQTYEGAMAWEHKPFVEEDFKSHMYRMAGWFDSIIILYKYYIENNNKSLLPCTMLLPRHAQTSTRKKYEKIKCPECGGLSVATNGKNAEQKRTCKKCGHEFYYSYTREIMEHQGLYGKF